MKDKPESEEYRPFQDVQELQWFLAQNQKFVDVLDELKLKITEAGGIRVTPAAGCPMQSSKCIPDPTVSTKGDPPPFKGRVLWGEK